MALYGSRDLRRVEMCRADQIFPSEVDEKSVNVVGSGDNVIAHVEPKSLHAHSGTPRPDKL